MSRRHVVDAKYVPAVADHGRTVFIRRGEESRDGVRRARRGCEHDRVGASADLLVEVGEKGIVENIVISPPVR